MTPADFARLALGLDGVEQGSHVGAVDFRVGRPHLRDAQRTRPMATAT